MTQKKQVMKSKRVFVSGSFDLIHSGHITFLKEAAKYGDLFVGIGSDDSILKYKGRLPVCLEDERLFMLRALECVKEVWVNTGEGKLDFAEDLEHTAPDILIVNEDQHTEEKELLCQDLGIAYYVLKRTQEPGLPARSTTQLRKL